MAVAVLSAPPTTTKFSFKKGDTHVGVWAIQRFLNAINYANFEETGFFGDLTETAVKNYQTAVGATIDGIVGPQTQERIVRSCRSRVPFGSQLPKGLVEGIINGESNGLLAAVNASVAGGVDCGLTQRRVYGPPYSSLKVAEAFDPMFNIGYSVANDDKTGVWDRYLLYRTKPGVVDRADAFEYVWRLAALAHNWPWAAGELAAGRKLSTTKVADWVPSSVKFPDGASVITYSDWAKYYALGSNSHNWPGYVTQLAFGVPQGG